MTGWLQTLIGTSGGAALIALMGFIFYRQRETASIANTALTTVKDSVVLTAKIRKAMDLQQDRLDVWEQWGKDVKVAWDRLRGNLLTQFDLDIGVLPTPPEGHLDLAAVLT